MVCYIVPAAAAALVFASGKRFRDNSLFLMLLGGSVFGAVDHLWNGELFLIGPNLASDLLLGVTITLAVVGTWFAVVLASKAPRPAQAEN